MNLPIIFEIFDIILYLPFYLVRQSCTSTLYLRRKRQSKNTLLDYFFVTKILKESSVYLTRDTEDFPTKILH